MLRPPQKLIANMPNRSFTVIVHKEEDMYIAECPEIGTVDQGDIEQAIAFVL